MKQYILIALVFFLATALTISVATNNALWRQVETLRTRLDNAQAELEVYHINDAEIQAHDRETWKGDTILYLPEEPEDSMEGE